MKTPVPAQTHFITSFRLRAAEKPKEPMISSVAKIIRRWVGEKEGTDEGLMGAWVFKGGTWRNRFKPKSFVRTLAEVGKRKEGDPEYWGLHYQQIDSEPKSRRFWYTDIGLHAVAESIIVLNLMLKVSRRISKT